VGLQEELAAERGALHAARAELENERASLAAAVAQTEERLAAFKRTRRYRLALRRMRTVCRLLPIKGCA
jgi:hypothetical protein